MPAQSIGGKAVAQRIIRDTRREIASLSYTPGLGVILVGDDPASHLYVGLKEKACGDAGIRFEKTLLPSTAVQQDVIDAVEDLNRRDDIDAILVQLPLPAHLDEDAVIGAMDPLKDVDGFHPRTLRAFVEGRSAIMPGLAAGILALAKSTGEDLGGRRAVVVANSETFFTPVAKALEDEGMTAAFRTADDPATSDDVRDADVVIVAVGRPGFVKEVKNGAIVIDIGTNRVNGRLAGDVDAESVKGHAAYLTPVPGGIGPVTVAMLLWNTVQLARRRRGA